MWTELIFPDDPRRTAVEAFIRSGYAAHHGADIRSFPERLIGGFAADGRVEAGCGVRLADDGFFSECYLERPVEVTLSSLFHRSVQRSHVLEVTTLASAQTFGALAVLERVVGEARGHGINYGLFTATGRLRRILATRSLDLREIGPARRESVRNPDSWGRYYDSDPRVCVMHDAPVARLTFFHRSAARVADLTFPPLPTAAFAHG